MEFLLIAGASLVAGAMIGSMLQFLIGRKSLQQYAAALLMDNSEQLRLRIGTIEKRLDEYRSELQTKSLLILQLTTKVEDYEKQLQEKNARIVVLENRINEVEKVQNGHGQK